MGESPRLGHTESQSERERESDHQVVKAPFPPSRMPASIELSIKLVVCLEWDADGKPRAGMAVTSYERVRKLAGAHLVHNAFWMVRGFCACQMLMRDPMHQINHGVIVYLLRAILWHYVESVEKVLQVPFKRAAEKLTARLNMVLDPLVGDNGQGRSRNSNKYFENNAVRL
jgi:hypothetical protein